MRVEGASGGVFVCVCARWEEVGVWGHLLLLVGSQHKQIDDVNLLYLVYIARSLRF